jgi:hypothetical protein
MKKGFWILAGSLLLALPAAADQAYAIKAGRLIDGQNAGDAGSSWDGQIHPQIA